MGKVLIELSYLNRALDDSVTTKTTHFQIFS